MVNSPQIKLNDENHLFSCFYTTETISYNTSYCYNAVSCWETLGPGIHLDITLTHTTLNVVANDTPSAPQQRRRAQQPKGGWPCLWASQIPIRSSTAGARTSLIHGGPVLHPARLKGIAPTDWVPDAILAGRICFYSRICTILSRRFWIQDPETCDHGKKIPSQSATGLSEKKAT